MARHIDPRTAFLIAFANAPIATFTPAQWRRLRADLKQFLRGAYPGRRPEAFPVRGAILDGGTDVDDAPPHLIKALQRHLIDKLFAPVIGERDRARRHTGGPVASTASLASTRIDAQGTVRRLPGSAVRLRVLVGVTDATAGGGTARTALVVWGPLPDVFLMLARVVLWTNAATPLRLCARCGTPFAALRADSECCSVACNKATWWHTPKGQHALDRLYKAGGWQRGARTGRRPNAATRGRSTRPT